MGFEAFLCMAILVLAAVATGVVRKIALSRGVLDLPNARSSHTLATPRGGGVSIVLLVSAGAILLTLRGMIDLHLAFAILLGGMAVATVGFLDDRAASPVSVRLFVHITAGVWAVGWLGGLPPLQLGDRIVRLGWSGNTIAVLGIVWAVNLFNFMDGIDGIAASEAVFVALGGTVISLTAGGMQDVTLLALILAAACSGFLLWNWPPARIFLGDGGSGYLGYAVAVIALASAHERPAALWSWLTLGGVFFVDATVTLLRRLVRGERLYEAHRSHAYQWLARRWRGHLPVTLAVLLVNVFWLLPCAVFANLHPALAAATTLIALAPLVALAVAAGSGRRETFDHMHPEA